MAKDNDDTLPSRAKMVEELKEIYKPTEERVKLRWRVTLGAHPHPYTCSPLTPSHYHPSPPHVTPRWKYEEGIKRPYFHVKPLERGQLKNWQDYLDFMKVRRRR